MTNKITNITIGGDPEYFFRNKETQLYTPSFLYLQGDKWNPTPISDKGHCIQSDNVMLEVNFPPCKTSKQFIKENNFLFDYVNRTICEPNNLEIVKFPYAEYPIETLQNERAQLFGCESDYCTYSKGEIPNSVGKPSETGRCCGGHLHIGYNNFNNKTNLLIIRALDIFLSVPLLFIEPDNNRKLMYGKAGAFRHTKFGVEYRSTSNYVYSSDKMMDWTFNSVMKAIDYLNSKQRLPRLFKDNTIQDIINNKDYDKAKDIMKMFKINTPETILV